MILKDHDIDGVSPVISVVLLVAIVVLLSAVLGAALLNMGNSTTDGGSLSSVAVKTTPNGDGTITIQVLTGSPDKIRIGVNGTIKQTISSPSPGDSVTVDAPKGSTITVIGVQDGESQVVMREASPSTSELKTSLLSLHTDFGTESEPSPLTLQGLDVKGTGDSANVSLVSISSESLFSKYRTGNWEAPSDVATDSNGNVIVAGYAKPSGGQDYYVIKYNSSGGKMWSASYNSGKDDDAYAVTVDSNGNVIITGYAGQGSSNSQMNMTTIKYAPDGSVLWRDTIDNGGRDVGKDVTVDSNGNIIVTGESNTNGTDNYYTVKYDSSGNILWTKAHDRASAEDRSFGVAVAPNGDIIVTGRSYDGDGGRNDLHTLRYSSSGSVKWTALYDSGDQDYGYSVDVSDSGDIIIAGRSYTSTWIGTVTKYSSSGSLQWRNTYNPQNRLTLYEVSIRDSTAYVVGTAYDGSTNNMLTARYTLNGSRTRTDVYDSGSDEHGRGIALTQSSVYITGNYDNGNNADWRTMEYGQATYESAVHNLSTDSPSRLSAEFDVLDNATATILVKAKESGSWTTLSSSTISSPGTTEMSLPSTSATKYKVVVVYSKNGSSPSAVLTSEQLEG